MSESVFREAISNIGLVLNSIRQRPDIVAATGNPRHFTWITAHNPSTGKAFEFFFNYLQSDMHILTVQSVEEWARDEMSDEWQTKWKNESKT